MADVKHTPAPWCKEFENGAYNIEAESPTEPGKTFVVAFGVSDRDAPLLLAAPALLEALQEIIADGVHCDVVPHLHRKAVAAIAKAIGGAARATEGSAT